jgi:4-aminobutyrate aminotransferase/(S)-3-amino-2-methylpropionate transaminase
MDAVHSGGLGGTFGGNPLACAAALASIETMEAEGLLARAGRIGAVMLGRLQAVAATNPGVGDARGRGAMVAVELVGPDGITPDKAAAGRVAAACHAQGVVVLTAGTYGNVVRLLPPLVIPDDLLEEGLAVLEDALAAI